MPGATEPESRLEKIKTLLSWLVLAAAVVGIVSPARADVYVRAVQSWYQIPSLVSIVGWSIIGVAILCVLAVGALFIWSFVNAVQ
jgi:hypothetical protein